MGSKAVAELKPPKWVQSKTAERSIASAPKRVVGRPFPKGRSGNPGGKSGRGPGTITGFMKEFGSLTPAQLREKVAIFDKALASAGNTPATMNAMIAAAVGIRLINDPEARLLGVWLDRTEGKLPTTVKTWQDEWIASLKAGGITPEWVRKTLGNETLAQELFRAAGVSVGN